MSKTLSRTAWNPGNKPTDIDGVWAEILKIKQGLEASSSYADFQVLYAAPLRPEPGRVVIADGTVWNPGSGEGAYRYGLAGTWVFLG